MYINEVHEIFNPKEYLDEFINNDSKGGAYSLEDLAR